MKWLERISVDPGICHGKACIKGTHVMVSVVLDNLANGEKPEQIAAAYKLEAEDVYAALRYGSELVKGHLSPQITPKAGSFEFSQDG